jgi:hypothetical protein
VIWGGDPWPLPLEQFVRRHVRMAQTMTAKNLEKFIQSPNLFSYALKKIILLHMPYLEKEK